MYIDLHSQDLISLKAKYIQKCFILTLSLYFMEMTSSVDKHAKLRSMFSNLSIVKVIVHVSHGQLSTCTKYSWVPLPYSENISKFQT